MIDSIQIRNSNGNSGVFDHI